MFEHWPFTWSWTGCCSPLRVGSSLLLCKPIYVLMVCNFSQAHSCSGLCSADGTCEIETAPQSIEATFTGRHETFQYTKVCQSNWYSSHWNWHTPSIVFPRFAYTTIVSEHPSKIHHFIQLQNDSHASYLSRVENANTQASIRIVWIHLRSISVKHGQLLFAIFSENIA